MIYGETYLTKYDWIIQLYILTNKDTKKHIFNILDKIDIDNKYKQAILNKFINFVDCGSVIHNIFDRISIIFIGQQSKIISYIDTIAHEKNHVEMCICSQLDINPESEEASYLSGYIASKLLNPDVFKLI